MNYIKRFLHSKMFHNYLLLMVSLNSIEVIFRLISQMNLISWAFLRIFIGINILSIIFSLIFSYMPKLFRYISSLVVIFAATFYAILQLGFNSFIGVYMSVNTSSQLGAVKDYVKDFLASFEPIYYLAAIPFILSLIYSIYTRNQNNTIRNYNNNFRLYLCRHYN